MSFEFSFSVGHLEKLIPKAAGGIQSWYEGLSDALPQYQIITVPRVAAFIAQCAHESGGFRLMEENLNYKAATLTKLWPARYPAGIAEQYAGKPQAIANKSYGGRMGNGDESSGDGWKFRGRGILQLTGRSNYTECSKYLFSDNTLVDNPDILFDPYYATHSACWFWNKHNLNALADAGDIKTMTKKINGGFIGLEDRIKHYKHAMEVLNGGH